MNPTEGDTPETSGPESTGHPEQGTAASTESSLEVQGREDNANTGIMGKYRNVDELIKAHRHLESKLGELGQKASLLDKAAERWSDKQGKALSPEDFLRFSEEALRKGFSDDPKVLPNDTVMDEVKQKLKEYDTIFGQLYVERERANLREKFPDYDEALLDFCISHSLPEENPEEMARFIAKQRQTGADQWASGKLNAGRLATERQGGASPPTTPAKVSFHTGGNAVSPLQAWMSEPET